MLSLFPFRLIDIPNIGWHFDTSKFGTDYFQIFFHIFEMQGACWFARRLITSRFVGSIPTPATNQRLISRVKVLAVEPDNQRLLIMAGGRPRLWKDPIELSNLIADYFNSTERPTLSGLAVFLEIDRQTLYNYKERDEFFDIIKKATAKVESIYEERAIYENNPTGVIFALKNMGWTDRMANDHTSGGEKIDLPIQWIKSDS